jgi:lambda repressor-like predicted transcriptional regulator
MKPLDIQYAIKAAGSSQAQIARELKVSKVTVSYVLAGKTTSRRIAEAIAKATGLSLDTLWPGKYPTTQEAA